MSDFSRSKYAEPSGTLGISVAQRLVVVVGSGFWSPEYVDAHFRDFAAAVARNRAEHKIVRVLLDLRAASVQMATTAERVSYWTDRIYLPGDRLAVIVSSQLMKAQLRRTAQIADVEIFLREDLARLWLDA